LCTVRTAPQALSAPVRGTPQEPLTAATKSTFAKSFFDHAGSEAWTTTQGELARFQAAETQKWGKVIKAAGIAPESIVALQSLSRKRR
jgi:tripartite-type tricarboxylate transporter receptor subunit TctC